MRAWVVAAALIVLVNVVGAAPAPITPKKDRRRQVPVALRVLIDMLRTGHRFAPAKGSLDNLLAANYPADRRRSRSSGCQRLPTSGHS